MSSSIHIKSASIEDAFLVSQIVASAYKDCQEKFKPFPEKMPSWFDWWISLSQPQNHQEFIKAGLTYLILLDEDVIGTFRLEHHGNQSELDDFCILPQYQNHGYGLYTLSLIEKLHDVDSIEFATPYFCTANLHLYQKAGYKQVGTRSDDTVICFEKKLNL